MLRDLYGDSRSFCESDLGLPFFHLRIDSSGWDGALLTSCQASLSPSDHNSDYDDWSLRLSLSETVLEQYGHNSPLADSTIRALMLATARSAGIVYDGKTAEALEQLTWEIVKFVTEKLLAGVWNLVGVTQHQGAAFLAVSLHQLLLKVHSLEEAGVQSFSYDFIRSQVFPHLTTKERDRVEGRPEASEDWEKRVRTKQLFESEDALGVSLSSSEESELISQLRSSQDQDEALQGEGMAWKRSIRLRLHSLMSDLAALEQLLGTQSSPEPFPLDYESPSPTRTEKQEEKTISADICVDSFHCFPVELLLTLGLLCSLGTVGYVEWAWHSRAQAVLAGGLAGAGTLLGLIGGAIESSYAGTMLLGLGGLGLGYGGYYGVLWGREVGKMAWRAVSFPSKAATPLVLSSPSHSPSLSSQP